MTGFLKFVFLMPLFYATEPVVKANSQQYGMHLELACIYTTTCMYIHYNLHVYTLQLASCIYNTTCMYIHYNLHVYTLQLACIYTTTCIMYIQYNLHVYTLQLYICNIVFSLLSFPDQILSVDNEKNYLPIEKKYSQCFQ